MKGKLNKEVLCSFIGSKHCENYQKECWHCKWNSNCDIGDYLILKTEDGKTIRYLETS
jgi:hypothetical protein